MFEQQGSLQEWLQSGWILERREAASSSSFLIGGGTFTPASFADLERSSCVVWAPSFFPGADEADSELSAGPLRAAWSATIRRDELLTWLSKGSSDEAPALSKISWIAPHREKFQKIFDRIRTAFREDGVKKAVPVVFSRGVGATPHRREWIRDRVRAGLEGTARNDLRLYGLWTETGGFIGATPEVLFTREGSEITSMAVAGTRALSVPAEKSNEADAVAGLVREFLNDPKERHEHEVVVHDIAAILSSFGDVKDRGEIEKSAIGVERFGALFHLVTHLRARFSKEVSVRDLTMALHPTPALGVAPRDPSLRLLRELHEISGEKTPRGGFGAPFVVGGNQVQAVVAIRQVRWTFEEGDRLRLVVGSGCGVVPESDVDREWSELASKRRAVMRLFRLSTEVDEPVRWSLSILGRLVDLGVRHFVVCAGARNAPLVVAAEALRAASGQGLDPARKITVESFFDERAASFYALGVAHGSGRPVAIITTSGTAVTEMVSAMAEADFSGVPLIAVTADRPRRLRFSGAPQSIPQNDVFKNFVERTWDLEEGDDFDAGEISRRRPLHVNVCLEEPLLVDVEREPAFLEAKAKEIAESLDSLTSSMASSPTVSVMTPANEISFAALHAALGKNNVIAIVGGLLECEREAVVAFLRAHAIPCWLEGTSGLRGEVRLRSLELRGGDREIQRWCREGKVDQVLRLGGIPTTRAWRDLDEPSVSVQTLSISRLRFSGLGRGQFIHLPGSDEFANFLRAVTPLNKRESRSEAGRGGNIPREEWFEADANSARQIESLVLKLSKSEPAFVRAISEIKPPAVKIYVGNSLPIRWWDLVATRDQMAPVEANRGVNGIDGQLSTALGFVAGDDVNRVSPSAAETWILLGDLTTLYDLSGPWAMFRDSFPGHHKIRIFVLNNSGGRIFTRVLAKAPGGAAPFENRHDLQFEKWADMWNLDYVRIVNPADLESRIERLGSRAVIELVPSAEETAAFWSGLK